MEAIIGLCCAQEVFAAEGEFALRECEFRGDGSVVSLSHRNMSQYAAFDSDKAQRASVTVFVKPGETPRVTFSGYPDTLTVERRFGRGTDKIITVDGATWEGQPDDTGRVRDWKVAVKPGWNNATVRVAVLSNKQRVGELTQSFRFYAYVFEVQPAGQLEHPLPGETGNFFLEHPLVDAAGNLYVHARRGKSETTVRYDPGGRISVRYEINPAMAGGHPFGVDEDGNLYVLIANNIVQFDRGGKFVKSIAVFGTSNSGVLTADDLKNHRYPSSTSPDSRDEVLRQIHPCYSQWETAMVGDAIYFIAEGPNARACGENHVLASLTLDGRVQILDKVNSASGVGRGHDGNLYIRERGKDEENGMLTYSPTGRLEQRRLMIGSLWNTFTGMDGAGFFYFAGHAWEPSLTAVKESAWVADGRYRRISPYRGQGYYVDLLTGQQSTSNEGHYGLASWMYRGAVYTAYVSDLRVARAVSLAPGASDIAPPATLKRGSKTRTAVTGGGTTTQHGGIPGGKTAIPTGKQPPASTPGTGDTTIDPSGGVISGDDVFTETQDEEISPATTALGTIAVSGITALGAGLMMLGMGVTPKDLIDGVRELFGGAATPPTVPPLPPPITHRDGDANEFGEVWSDEDRGWVGRNLYEEEKARRTWIADKAVTDLQSGQSEDVKKAYDKWQESQRKLEEVREEGRMLIKKENLREWVRDRERDLQEQNYWSDVKNNFLVNVDKELTDLPHETFEICRETAKALKSGVVTVTGAVKSGVDTVADVLSDATNWEIIRATGAQTATDIIGSPLQSAGKVNKFYHDVARGTGSTVGKIASGAGNLAVNIVANPVEMIKAVTGYENWSKALDYNVPLSKRIGHALMGTVDTVSMFGGALVKETGAAIAKGAEAADKIVDAAKADMLATKADDLARKLGPDDIARHNAWELGEQQAKQKVATLQASKSPEELRAAVLEIQGDKRGLQMLNRDARELKATFNQEIRSIYKETDAAVETRLKDALRQKGADMDRYDLKPTHATNPSKDPFKIGADRDITYSLYDKKTGQWVRDVPADKVQKVYDEEFFKAAHGKPPTSVQEATDFAKKMDQQCVDARHAEAYGRSPADLQTALKQPGTPFSDPTQVGKTISYKSHEWYGRAEHAMQSGKAVDAEKFMSEGFRQTTKQFDNILVQRHDALRQAGAEGLKNIPDRMQKAIGALKSAEEGVSPVLIQQRIKQLGYDSPGDLATQIGEYVEAMDKFRPASTAGSMPNVSWRTAYTAVRTVAAGYQQGGGTQ